MDDEQLSMKYIKHFDKDYVKDKIKVTYMQTVLKFGSPINIEGT